jgi:tetratricopeptide (TPR) repeat protein
MRISDTAAKAAGLLDRLRAGHRLLLISALLIPAFAPAQVDEARQAIERKEYVRAVNILSAALADRPAPDIYLYLGIAYRRMKEYRKAQDVLNEGSKRYPDDARFHIELANLFLENNDIDAAKSELRRALIVEPNNSYASDQLAVIDMSEGEVQSALRSWNKSDRPFINDILHNYYLNFGSWVVRRGVTFHPAATLRYSAWKTTESRLLETGAFANVGLEIEPTLVPDQYNAVVRTTTKTNLLTNLAFSLVKGAPVQTSYLDIWNIGNGGINFNGNYRWDANKRRAEGRLKIPLPIAGLLHLEIGNTWRSERWNLSPTISPEFQPEARFIYKANALGVRVKQIPHYRIELAAGFEYLNRAANGDLPELFTDSLNTGLFTAETNLRIFDGKYQNRLHLEAFAARRSIVGNMQFTGGVAELNNRVTLSKDTGTYFDWSLKGGSVSGQALPVENYFMLGVSTRTANRLRGHSVTENGEYGRGPMGTDFVLANMDIERRFRILPLFNTFNIPFVAVKWELFLDAAKTWDRNHIFQPSKLLLDAGAGLRLETPADSFNVGYGKSLRDGQNVLFGYYERRLW